MKNSKVSRKVANKLMKAVYLVHTGVNTLNEFGMYNYELARRKAKSYQYWIAK